MSKSLGAATALQHPTAGVGSSSVSTASAGTGAELTELAGMHLAVPLRHERYGKSWRCKKKEAWMVMEIKHMVVWVARCIISKFGLSQYPFFKQETQTSK